jgi:hypothetical protein
MSTPTLTSRTDTDITVAWTQLTGTDTGNSDILTYNLYWDDGTTTVDTQLVDQLVYTYSVTGGLTAGTAYLF